MTHPTAPGVARQGSWEGSSLRDGRSSTPARFAPSTNQLDRHLTEILRYTAAGYAVLPISRDKVPLLKHGSRGASKDPAVVEGRVRRWGCANVAIACGPISNCWVLDVDGPAGKASLAQLVRHNGPLPTAPANLTARGYHIVLEWPADGRSPKSRCGKLGAGLDIRSDGCCFIVAPSIHASGIPYRWAAERSIFDLAPPPAPDWLLNLVCDKPEPAPQVERIGCGTRYGAAALDSAVCNIAAAPDGQQEATLNSEAYGVGRLVAGGVLPRSAREALIAAGLAMRNFDPRRPWLRSQIIAKVDRCFSQAAARPKGR